jgi:D-threo-aldose 1-dehydrogenase
MNPARRLGRTGLNLSTQGFGGVPLGELYEKVDESRADETLSTAWENGFRYYDTSPWYGRGLSELRFGRFLRSKPRSEFILSTKIGRTFHRPPDPSGFIGEFWKGGLPFEHRFDYTYDGVMRSYEQSLMRLGINSVDLLLIHDLDVAEIGSEDLVRHHMRDLRVSGWKALEALRAGGEIRGVGAGVNILGIIPQMLASLDVDFFLVAMPYTLVDQKPLDEEFPLCAERDVGIIVGSPFASGILATGTGVAQPMYNYAAAAPEVIARVSAIEAICSDYGVPLKAAAYQFPLRHPIVASVVAGSAAPSEVAENAGLLNVRIPDDFWAALRARGLVHPDAP